MDLDKCLDILRSRPICEASGEQHDHGHHHHQHHGAPPSSSSQEQPPMGQVIDLLPSPSEQGQSGEAATAAADSSNEGAADAQKEEEEKTPPEARTQASVAKLREGLRGLGAKKLLAAFRQAQEDRARAYAAFEVGLARVLESRDFAGYNGVCAEATASFAALSNMVNAIETELLEQAQAAAAAGLVRRVQVEEKEKLSLTAALHLERFRLATSSCGSGGGGGSSSASCGGGSGSGTDNDDASGAASSTSSSSESLLREGVKMLEGRLGEIKGRINDVLEGLRYEEAEIEAEE